MDNLFGWLWNSLLIIGRRLAAWMVMDWIAEVCTWSGRGVTAAHGSVDMFPMS
jgi:hypothetical protein